MLTIELAIVEYPELDYSEIGSNINVIVIEFNAKVDARSTRKGNKGTQIDTDAAYPQHSLIYSPTTDFIGLFI